MPQPRISTIVALCTLLGTLTACGAGRSSGAPTTVAPATVRDAALAFQTAMLNSDAAGACAYLDPDAIKAQIAKAGPALAGKDCLALFTMLMAISHPSAPAKEITVVSQSADSATVRTVDASGNVQLSTWRLEDGGWKLVSTRRTK